MTTPTGRRMKEGNASETSSRGSDRNPWHVRRRWWPARAAAHTASPASSTAPSVASGSGAQIKVGGTDLAGVNPASVTCVKTGGKIDIGSGSTGGAQQALAVVMTDEATPKVESLALVVDGNALSVSQQHGREGRLGQRGGGRQDLHHHRSGAGRRHEEPDGRNDHQGLQHQGDVRLIGRTPGGGRAFTHTSAAPGARRRRRQRTYDAAVSIPGELERARRLAFAADETRARDLLLSLIPAIEREDRDDLMLEVLAQLGEIYLARGANDGVRESIRRIRDCLASYSGIAAGTMPEAAGQVTMSDAEVAHMIRRYSRRAQFLQTGLAAALGDHEGAAAALTELSDTEADADFAELADEHAYLRIHAQILCATALCDDDLHVRSVPLWERVLDGIDSLGNDSEFADQLLMAAATAYGRFCVETGRLTEAEPWLRRAGARAQARGWELANARTQLERAAACWSVGDHATTEQLVSEAQPVITRYARAHDIARCWLYLGFTRLAVRRTGSRRRVLGACRAALA